MRDKRKVKGGRKADMWNQKEKKERNGKRGNRKQR